MCGIAGIISQNPDSQAYLPSMNDALDSIRHRGPDAKKTAIHPHAALGHVRLSIIDLNELANQPMISNCGRYTIVYNGEVYNYLEIREKIKHRYNFKTNSDTEVILAYYILEGKQILNELNGMFAFAIWDNTENSLFAARDRFGVKPFHYSVISNTLVFASEIKAIHATGMVDRTPNESIWATYFKDGLYDFNEETFWSNIYKLPAGHTLVWSNNNLRIDSWYDLTEKISIDSRNQSEIEEELLFLLEDTVRLRFRSDVPVGLCLSGGLDSSLLLGLIQKVKGKDYPIHAFTFYTGDDRYDELQWVKQMITNTGVIHHACKLSIAEIPDLAKHISYHMDEPYGGIPTLGMSKVFEKASELGVKVLLDGNGLDEAWGGYEYYQRTQHVDFHKGPVQGSKQLHTLEACLNSHFLKKAKTLKSQTFNSDTVTNLQLRDILMSKIPRAMRFADRNSMAYSVELREPFLDHRIVELGLNQPIHNKIYNMNGKYLVRKLAKQIIPTQVGEAPKRALQTPQREWLAIELSSWITQEISIKQESNWFTKNGMINEYQKYQNEMPDNSFYIWQMVTNALMMQS